MTPDASWLERAVGASLADPSLEGEVELVVPPSAGRPRGRRTSSPDDGPPTVRATLTLSSGRVVSATAGAAAKATCTLTLAAPDLADLLAGTEPSVLFMQGRLKVDGDLRTALALLQASAAPGFAAALPRG